MLKIRIVRHDGIAVRPVSFSGRAVVDFKKCAVEI